MGHAGFGILKLVVEDAVAIDVRLDTPVFDLDGLFQLVEVGRGAVEDLEEPASQRQDWSAVVHIVIVRLHINVPNEGLGVGGVILGESRLLPVCHLLNPPCWLHQPFFSRDVELRGPSIPVEAVPLGALF